MNVSVNAQMIATCLGVTSVHTASALALSSRCPGVFSEAGLGVPNILFPLPIAPSSPPAVAGKDAPVCPANAPWLL